MKSSICHPLCNSWSQLTPTQFVVVKGVVTPEKAAEYAQKGEEWLEGFKLGYKRDDPSTWDVKKLPKHNRGGLYSQ